jgi:hypothetical protein
VPQDCQVVGLSEYTVHGRERSVPGFFKINDIKNDESNDNINYNNKKDPKNDNIC